MQRTCFTCNKTFDKSTKECNRAKKRGAKDFCSLNCSGIYSNKLHPRRGNIANFRTPEAVENRRKAWRVSPFTRFLNRARAMNKKKGEKGFGTGTHPHKQNPNRDESSEGTKPQLKVHPFGQFLNSARGRSENREIELTRKDLEEIWDKQKGICPLTGWALVLKTSRPAKGEFIPNRASIDRIDSSKGYTKDNIRFIALMGNYAKFTFTDQQVIDFCIAVADNARAKQVPS